MLISFFFSCAAGLSSAFFFFFFLSSSLLDEEEEDEEEEEEDEEEELSEEELSEEELSEELESLSTSCCCCCIIILGAFLRCSRSCSVRPPRPIEVKKLMANLVFLGLSLGNNPVKWCAIELSCIRSFIFANPKCSHRSWNKILIKIREDDVVSSSLSVMYDMQLHEMESV